MKKPYEKPVVEITVFEIEELITASGLDNDGSFDSDWE